MIIDANNGSYLTFFCPLIFSWGINSFNPIRPGGGSEARMAKLTAANQKPLIL